MGYQKTHGVGRNGPVDEKGDPIGYEELKQRLLAFAETIPKTTGPLVKDLILIEFYERLYGIAQQTENTSPLAINCISTAEFVFPGPVIDAAVEDYFTVGGFQTLGYTPTQWVELPAVVRKLLLTKANNHKKALAAAVPPSPELGLSGLNLK